jgi:release factor glutamine methyltransferase
MSLKLKKDTPLKISELLYIIQKNIPHLSKAAAIDFVSHLTGIKRDRVLSSFNDIILLNDNIIQDISLVLNGYPVSYLRKSHNFFGLDLYVDENVLIPRVETEVLVLEVLNRTDKKESINILDLCTGSGCILIALLNELKNAKGTGVDISFEALKVARMNAAMYNMEKRISFINGDILYLDRFIKNRFDVITINPPYVDKMGEYNSFIKYEPEIALFAEDKGLFFYKKMLLKLEKLCKRGGLIFFEIGYGQVDALKEIYSGKNIEFVLDYSGIERVMVWKN